MLAAWTVSQSAHAAEPSAGDRETARSLGTQGVIALDAHDYPTAERACGGAYALVKAPTVGTCWGRALEGLGRLIEARDVLVEVAHLPARQDEPAVFTSARDAARTEAEALAKRVPTVTLVVSGPPEATPLRVAIDGASVRSETARLPRKVNPGEHTISVSAPGFEPTTAQVTIAEGEDRRVEVLLPPSKEGTGGPVTHPSSTGGSSPPVLAIVAGGVGVVGLAIGIAAGVAGSSKHSTLSGECDGANGTCPPSAASDLDAFHSLRTGSTTGYVVGALGLVAGGRSFLRTAHLEGGVREHRALCGAGIMRPHRDVLMRPCLAHCAGAWALLATGCPQFQSDFVVTSDAGAFPDASDASEAQNDALSDAPATPTPQDGPTGLSDLSEADAPDTISSGEASSSSADANETGATDAGVCQARVRRAKAERAGQ